MTEHQARRKAMTDRLYKEIQLQHPALFQGCLGIGTTVLDSIENRGMEPVAVAAEAERNAVLLVAHALGLR